MARTEVSKEINRYVIAHELKNKTNEKYNNLSVGKKQFSINGTTRSQGWVGQSSLSRTVTTPSICLNDNRVIKSSVVETNGMIKTKYRWIRRPAPFSVVKPDAILEIHISYYLMLYRSSNFCIIPTICASSKLIVSIGIAEI